MTDLVNKLALKGLNGIAKVKLSRLLINLLVYIPWVCFLR